MNDENNLTIDYIGEFYRLVPGETLEFGREAELSIDSNEYLHRRLGRFQWVNEMWFLFNIGRSLFLNVFDIATHSQAVIGPGREYAFTFSPAHVRFRAGRVTYELIVTGGDVNLPDHQEAEQTVDTVIPSEIPLTASQRLLIVALAEPTLRHPMRGVQIPPSRQAAKRLRWKMTTFNRKLDNVCEKLTRAGVPGLHGAPGALATDRKRHLVAFAVQSGLIQNADLGLLEGAGSD